MTAWVSSAAVTRPSGAVMRFVHAINVMSRFGSCHGRGEAGDLAGVPVHLAVLDDRLDVARAVGVDRVDGSDAREALLLHLVVEELPTVPYM